MIFIKIVLRTSKDKWASMFYQKIPIFNYPKLKFSFKYTKNKSKPPNFFRPTNQNPQIWLSEWNPIIKNSLLLRIPSQILKQHKINCRSSYNYEESQYKKSIAEKERKPLLVMVKLIEWSVREELTNSNRKQ